MANDASSHCSGIGDLAVVAAMAQWAHVTAAQARWGLETGAIQYSLGRHSERHSNELCPGAAPATPLLSRASLWTSSSMPKAASCVPMPLSHVAAALTRHRTVNHVLVPARSAMNHPSLRTAHRLRMPRTGSRSQDLTAAAMSATRGTRPSPCEHVSGIRGPRLVARAVITTLHTATVKS